MRYTIFKYAGKFSSLTTPQLVELIKLQKKHQYRFYSSYWAFRWWKSNDNTISMNISKQDLSYANQILYSDLLYVEAKEDTKIKAKEKDRSESNFITKILNRIKSYFS